MQIEPSLRASDADREQVAERLRHATAEGRLSEDELEERLEALYAARTYGALHALTVDLPVSRSLGDQPRARLRRVIGAVGALTLVLSVLSLLAIMRAHAAVAVLGTGSPRHLILPGPLPVQHQLPIAGVLLGVAFFAVLLTCAALVWALMDSRSRRHLRISRPSERR
jgi:Domain of unknown function (DUF1707)